MLMIEFEQVVRGWCNGSCVHAPNFDNWGIKPQLLDFVIQAITGGTDAQGEVTVRIKEEGRIFVGHGASTDIIIASAKAYLSAINRLLFTKAEETARGLD